MLTRQKLGPELKAWARPCSPKQAVQLFLRRERVPRGGRGEGAETQVRCPHPAQVGDGGFSVVPILRRRPVHRLPSVIYSTNRNPIDLQLWSPISWCGGTVCSSRLGTGRERWTSPLGPMVGVGNFTATGSWFVMPGRTLCP